MTQHNLTQILKVIRDLVMRNRPCYRDYIGNGQYDTKLLPEYLLPDFLRKNVVASKAEVQSAADAAQRTADMAKITADKAKGFRCYLSTNTSTRTLEFDGVTTGRDTLIYNEFDYYKISEFAPTDEQVVTFSGTRSNGQPTNEVTPGEKCCQYGLFIAVYSAGSCKIGSLSFVARSPGLYAKYAKGNEWHTAGTATFTFYQVEDAHVYDRTLFVSGDKEIVLKSSTANSTKQFRITVNDTGKLLATEVT